MKILRLDIEGYRSLKNVSWTPGNLNVVIGPNGSGKSNLLRMLELIAMSARGRLSKHVLRSGGMGQLVWDGKSERIKYRLEASPDVVQENEKFDRFTYVLEMERIKKSASFSITSEFLKIKSDVQTENKTEQLRVLERHGSKGQIYSDTMFPIEYAGKAAQLHESTLMHDSIPDEETFLSWIGSGPSPQGQNKQVDAFQSELADISVYHDVRTDPKSEICQASISRYEKRVEPDGQNLISVLHTLYAEDRNFKRDIDIAMRAAFGDDYEEITFPPVANQMIELRIRWKGLTRTLPSADLSDGTLRFLMLLTILTSPESGSVIAIDEPETGLHPSMFPIICEYAAEAANRSQVIFTTHSPEFLDAFEKGSEPTTTVAEWVDGETKLKVIDGEELKYWLKKYSLGALHRSGELENMG